MHTQTPHGERTRRIVRELAGRLARGAPRSLVAETLRRLVGHEPFDLLGRTLRSAGEEARLYAVTMLGASENPHALAAVDHFYADPSPRVRREAFWAAYELGGDWMALDAAGEALLGDRDVQVRVAAAFALGITHAHEAREYLERALRRPGLAPLVAEAIRTQLACMAPVSRKERPPAAG